MCVPIPVRMFERIQIPLSEIQGLIETRFAIAGTIQFDLIRTPETTLISEPIRTLETTRILGRTRILEDKPFRRLLGAIIQAPLEVPAEARALVETVVEHEAAAEEVEDNQ